jgi:hypothetical protein
MYSEKNQVTAKSWAERQTIQDAECDSYFFTTEKQQGATALMLDFEFENGNRLALPYPGLMKIAYNRSVGITLEWGSEHITVTGRNLGDLYANLVKHRVNAIREAGMDFSNRDVSELVVHKIEREKGW